MTEFDLQDENENIEFFYQAEEFIDALLAEVLKERSHLENEYYLPGVPVTDSEVLGVLQDAYFPLKASNGILELWEELQEEMDTEGVGEFSTRMVKLRWFYSLHPVWCLAVLITFFYEKDPKYEKVFLLLQGDSGRKGVDLFLIGALATYLGLGTENLRAELWRESQVKAELFTESSKGEMRLRKNVFLWLNGQKEIQLTRQKIFQIQDTLENAPKIFEKENVWCEHLIRKQIQDKNAEPVIFEVIGRRGAGKKVFAGMVVAEVGYKINVLKMSSLLSGDDTDKDGLIQEYLFSCRVNGCIPYLDLSEVAEEYAQAILVIKKMTEEYGVVFVGAEPGATLSGKLELSTRKILLDRLSMEDSLLLWQWMGEQFPMEEDVDYEQLAGKYRLLPGLITEIFIRAEEKRWSENKDEISSELLLSCIRECNQFSGNSLMERIDTVFTWKELRVEPQVISGMQLACAHLKYRFAMEKTMGKQTPYGKGVGVLMYGPPGTGKTMAAQVMANELGMELYRVDLSQVTSKYIGETEKNLESVFREAEHSNVILFFDEADSLFGKRTEVKDSNDKYANQETSYILQRIESYEGMIILATNLIKNFDSAFMRRITISIRFSEPDEEMRKLLWKDMLQNTALAGEDVWIENLAKQFELTGSNIKSIVRNALFMSFMEQRELRIEDVVKAIKVEFEKLGKIPNLSSFGMFFTYV